MIKVTIIYFVAMQIQIDQTCDPTKIAISGTPQSLHLALSMVRSVLYLRYVFGSLRSGVDYRYTISCVERSKDSPFFAKRRAIALEAPTSSQPNLCTHQVCGCDILAAKNLVTSWRSRPDITIFTRCRVRSDSTFSSKRKEIAKIDYGGPGDFWYLKDP